VINAGRHFRVIDRKGNTVARAKLSLWFRTAAFDVGGVGYLAYCRGWNLRQAILERADGDVSVVVHSAGTWSRDLMFQYAGHDYQVRNENRASLYYIYRDGVGPVGGFDRGPIFPRAWLVHFPRDLPLAVSVFLLWRVSMEWGAEDVAV
jgi:hypothetical protein